MTASGATVEKAMIPHPVTGERVLVVIHKIPSAPANAPGPAELRRARRKQRIARQREDARAR